MTWTWVAEYLIGPGVILMICGSAGLPWWLPEFDKAPAILWFFGKNVYLSG